MTRITDTQFLLKGLGTQAVKKMIGIFFLFAGIGFLSAFVGLTIFSLSSEEEVSPGEFAFNSNNVRFSDVNPLAKEQSKKYKVQLGKSAKEVGLCIHSRDGGDIECINKFLQDAARRYGARFALDVIEPLGQTHPFIATYAHDFAHTIGIYATEARGIKSERHYSSEAELTNRIGKVLVDCDGWGAFGCYHGVIEVGLSQLSSNSRTRVVRKACLENPLIQSQQYYINQCIHWFGHGMAIFTNQTLNETLAICEGMSNNFGSDEVQLCLSGVFHAGSVPGGSDVDFLDNIARVYSKEDVYYPCRDLPERFRGQCFSHIPGRTGKPDMDLVFRNCNNIPERDPQKKLNYIHRCYNSGSNILLVNTQFNAQQVVKDCQTYAHPDYLRYCYAGAVRYWILRDPLLNNRGPFEICERVEKEAKSTCYRSLGAANFENYYSREVLQKYCKKISEPAYYNECLALNIPD